MGCRVRRDQRVKTKEECLLEASVLAQAACDLLRKAAEAVRSFKHGTVNQEPGQTYRKLNYDLYRLANQARDVSRTAKEAR